MGVFNHGNSLNSRQRFLLQVDDFVYRIYNLNYETSPIFESAVIVLQPYGCNYVRNFIVLVKHYFLFFYAGIAISHIIISSLNLNS